MRCVAYCTRRVPKGRNNISGNGGIVKPRKASGIIPTEPGKSSSGRRVYYSTSVLVQHEKRSPHEFGILIAVGSRFSPRSR